MTDDRDVPPELEEMDRALRGARFDPRASFGPELLGRLRQGERTGPVVRRRPRPMVWAAAAALIVAMGAGLFAYSNRAVLIDRCCYDLDGGGDADDGVTIVAQRDAKVHRIQVYEDRDGSGDFSSADVVRLDRSGEPAIRDGSSSGFVTTEHCCLDFDGGGPADDALLVIGVPPDRVMMAAIYERRPVTGRGHHGPDAFQLR